MYDQNMHWPIMKAIDQIIQDSHKEWKHGVVAKDTERLKLLRFGLDKIEQGKALLAKADWDCSDLGDFTSDIKSFITEELIGPELSEDDIHPVVREIIGGV